MRVSRKGIILAMLQLVIVASLAAKYAIDRARFPRVWTRATAYDPNLPIRGRYLSLQLAVNVELSAKGPPAGAIAEHKIPNMFWGTLDGRNGQLIVTVARENQGVPVLGWTGPNRQAQYALMTPVLFFLPEHAQDPWQEARGGELWVEVTVPEKGPPRPIRLAVKKGDTFTPLEIK